MDAPSSVSPPPSDAETLQRVEVGMVSMLLEAEVAAAAASLCGSAEPGGTAADQPRPAVAAFADVGRDQEGVPSCALYYELHGDPHAPHKLLLIAGFCSTSATWDCQVEYFSRLPDHQVCVFDNRSCGRSRSKRINLSTRLFAEDARDLLDHICWHENIHLVGLSMGGMIAQELALLDSKRFTSLTLAVTHAGGPMSIAPVSGWPHIFSFMRARSKEAKTRALMKLNFSKKGVEERSNHLGAHVERFWGAQLLDMVGHTLAVARHFVSTKRLELLRNAHFPILVITGTEDNLVRPENSYMLAEFLRAEFIEIEGGHMINIEKHEQFNAALHAHLAKSLAGKPNTSGEDSTLNTLDINPEEHFPDFSRVEIFTALPRY